MSIKIDNIIIKNSKLIMMVLIPILICVGHVYSSFLVYIGLALFLLESIVSILDGEIIIILLFFLPFINVLRLNTESFSLYTLVVLISAVFLAIKNCGRKNYKTSIHTIITVLMIIYAIVISYIRENEFGISEITTLLSYLAIIIIAKKSEPKNYRYAIIVFATGVVTSCLISLYFQRYSDLQAFIIMDTTDVFGAFRVTGFTGDGNRLAAELLCAMISIMILSLQKKDQKNMFLIVLIAVIFACGILTLSKMFLLLAFVAVFIWLYALFSQRGMGKSKLVIVFGLFAAVFIILQTGILDVQIGNYKERFKLVTDLNSFSTNRTTLWENYTKYIISNPDVLLFGLGANPQYLLYQLNGKYYPPHNIIIEAVYKYGLFGTSLIVYWFAHMLKIYRTKKRSNTTKEQKLEYLLMCIGLFVPWLGLPTLDFDDFIVIPVFGSMIRNRYILTEAAENRDIC